MCNAWAIGMTAICLATAAGAHTNDVTWRCVGPGGGGWIQSILASRHADNAVFVGCDVGGFYRSDNGGASYTIHNAGFEDYFVECLTEHPTDARVLYAGCKGGVYKSTDGGASWQWQRQGFPPISDYAYSAMVSQIALDPQHPETVYAAIGQPREEKGGHGALYKSENGGASWRNIVRPGQLPADLPIYDLTINTHDPQRLLIATAHGVFASGDGGETWTASNAGLPTHLRTRRLAQSPSNPNIVYVSLKGRAGETPWQAGVYRSDDGGRSWQPRVNGLRHATGRAGTSDMLCAWVDRVVVHPQNPDIVYAGGATWWDATVYKTTDGGQHWTSVFDFGEKGNARRAWITFWGPTVTCLALSPRTPDTLFFGTSGYIYKTQNGGATWQPAYTEERNDGLIRGTGLEVTCLHTVAPHPRIDGRVFFGFYDIGLLISEDNGATFRRSMTGIPRGYDNSCFTVAFAEDDDAHVWAGFGEWGHNAGLLAESRDNGATWTPLNRAGSGLPDARPRCLLRVPPPANDADPRQRLLYVAEEHGVFESRDNGATWTPRSDGLPAARVRSLVRDAKTGALFAGVACKDADLGAVYRSTDGGASWQRVSAPGTPFAEIRQMAAQNGRLYATTRGAKAGPRYLPGGVFRSDDGTTWHQVYTHRFCEAIALDPRRPDRVYASLHDHPYHDRSTGGGVIASDDGGASWRSLVSPSLTCKSVTWIAVTPTAPTRLWLGTGGNAAFAGDVDANP